MGLVSEHTVVCSLEVQDIAVKLIALLGSLCIGHHGTKLVKDT